MCDSVRILEPCDTMRCIYLIWSTYDVTERLNVRPATSRNVDEAVNLELYQ